MGDHESLTTPSNYNQIFLKILVSLSFKHENTNACHFRNASWLIYLVIFSGRKIKKSNKIKKLKGSNKINKQVLQVRMWTIKTFK